MYAAFIITVLLAHLIIVGIITAVGCSIDARRRKRARAGIR